MRGLNIISAVAAIFLAVSPLVAQDHGHAAFGAGGYFCYIPNVDNISDDLFASFTYPTYNVNFGFDTGPEDNDKFAEAYNYPFVGVGLSLADYNRLRFKNNSRYSNTVSLYGFMETPFVKTDRISFGYTIHLGAGYTHDLYDPFTNPSNGYVGSRALVYVGAGLQFKYFPTKHLELGVNALLWHHSNGKINMPNCGLNQGAVGVYARYHLDEPYMKQVRLRDREKPEFPKGLHYDISVQGGWKSCEAEWWAYNADVEDAAKKRTDFAKVFRCGVCVDAMYRYSLVCASGIGLDLMYSPDGDLLRDCDTKLYGAEAVAGSKGYSPFFCGVAAIQEFYYRNLAAFISVGGYIFHKAGIAEDLGWSYQKLGFRYYFPKLGNTFVGWCCKAQEFCRADYVEMSIGIRI